MKVDTPQPNDILLFHSDLKTKVINHAGIFVQTPDKFIQALKSGVILSSINKILVKSRIEGIYRLCHV